MSESRNRQPIGPAHAELGRHLRNLRERHGQDNLRRFAEDVGIAPSTLSDAEKGIGTPSKTVVLRIVKRLGGNEAQFLRLRAAAAKEKEALKEKRNRIRNGEGVSKDDAIEQKPPYPLIEVVQSDGSIVEMQPVDIMHDEINLSGPFVIEQAEEHHVINSQRVSERTMFTRVLRATEPGFQIFPYSFDEDPEALMERIVVSVQSPAVVTEVRRRARNGYIFLIKLPVPLDCGERFILRFSLATFGGEDFTSTGAIYKQQMVHTERVLLSVEFRSDEHPIEVGWILMPYPAWSMVVEKPQLEKDKMLPHPPSGVYEKEFTNPMEVGQVVGLGWRFAE